jgi:hypothetical protein
VSFLQFLQGQHTCQLDDRYGLPKRLKCCYFRLGP